MAIAPTALDNGINTTDATSFTTLSIAGAANYNTLLTCIVYSVAAADPNIPTFSQQRNWNMTQVATALASTDHARMTLFRTCKSSGPGSGTWTIDFAGQTQTICVWDIVSWTGTGATGANNGSDGIGVSATLAGQSNATSGTVTLAALQSGSATMGGFAHAFNEATTTGAGYTQLISNLGANNPSTAYKSIYKIAGDTTPNASWTNSVHRYGVGVEILAPVVGGGQTAFVGPIPI